MELLKNTFWNSTPAKVQGVCIVVAFAFMGLPQTKSYELFTSSLQGLFLCD